MRILNEKEAKYRIEANFTEQTVIIGKDETDYIFYATLENREVSEEHPDGIVMNQYGRSGWTVTEDKINELFGICDHNLIDAIVEYQGWVAGDMYIHDTNAVEDYMDDSAYETEITYIYVTNDEIVSWLPFLDDRHVYCFIIQPEAEIRRKYSEEEDYINRTEDAKFQINFFFGLDVEDEPITALSTYDYNRYCYLIEHIDDIIERFNSKWSAEYDENSMWREAIRCVLEWRKESND